MGPGFRRNAEPEWIRTDDHDGSGEDRFAEVYVKASLAACERRDPKGLYVKARAGQIAEFTGVSSTYEEPENADLVLDTEAMSIEETLRALYNYVVGRVKT